ncbi:nucleotide sugar dehydrogenase [Candidatus Desantisbacteria bacterium]|nr:nucleotide sugar dehydrogenase [Candidatus Desantisbacteria bacterium]
MNISIFGLGYVGVVSAGCLASRGHKIIGVDINENKVDMLNKGISPIIEKDLPELLSQAKEKGLLSATTDTANAINSSEISLICVGTPSRANGSLNTKYIENVCEQIGDCLKLKKDAHILIFRSTMLPGTNRETIIPLLEKRSEKKEGKDFFVVFNPEFLREGTAVYDFNNPPKTVIGASTPSIADKVLKLYEGLPGPMIKTTLEVAEMVKYVDNNFHALKITFANEIGHICKKLGLDSHDVMNIFMQDTKLNISTYYLKPGFAFGGSCLPKDLRAINYMAKMLDLETPLLNSLMHSNNVQILATIKQIILYGKKKIGIAGFSFKAGTDDLRESPIIEVIETLLGKGYDLKLYDKSVSIAKLMGANKEYINNHIPHISSLMVDSLDVLLKDREVIIIGNNDKEFERLLSDSREDQIIYDLVRIGAISNARSNYQGICW